MYAGSRVRTLAKVFLVLMILLTFILSATLARQLGGFGLVTFCLSFIAGIIISMISFWCMDAFGALVESSEMQVSYLDKILSEVKSLNIDGNTSTAKDFKLSSISKSESITTWTCPHCHKQNSIKTNVCSCGQRQPL